MQAAPGLRAALGFSDSESAHARASDGSSGLHADDSATAHPALLLAVASAARAVSAAALATASSEAAPRALLLAALLELLAAAAAVAPSASDSSPELDATLSPLFRELAAQVATPERFVELAIGTVDAPALAVPAPRRRQRAGDSGNAAPVALLATAVAQTLVAGGVSLDSRQAEAFCRALCRAVSECSDVIAAARRTMDELDGASDASGDSSATAAPQLPPPISWAGGAAVVAPQLVLLDPPEAVAAASGARLAATASWRPVEQATSTVDRDTPLPTAAVDGYRHDGRQLSAGQLRTRLLQLLAGVLASPASSDACAAHVVEHLVEPLQQPLRAFAELLDTGRTRAAALHGDRQ